jgi:hypothetical protein
VLSTKSSSSYNTSALILVIPFVVKMIWFLFTAVYILSLLIPSTQASNPAPVDPHKCDLPAESSISSFAASKLDKWCFHSSFASDVATIKPYPTGAGTPLSHFSSGPHNTSRDIHATVSHHDHDRHVSTTALQPPPTIACLHCARQLYEGEPNKAGRNMQIDFIAMGLLFVVGMVVRANF